MTRLVQQSHLMEGKALEQAVCDRPIARGLCFVTNVLPWLVTHTPEPDRGSKDVITGRIVPNTAFRRLSAFPMPRDSHPPSWDTISLQAFGFTSRYAATGVHWKGAYHKNPDCLVVAL